MDAEDGTGNRKLRPDVGALCSFLFRKMSQRFIILIDNIIWRLHLIDTDRNILSLSYNNFNNFDFIARC